MSSVAITAGQFNESRRGDDAYEEEGDSGDNVREMRQAAKNAKAEAEARVASSATSVNSAKVATNRALAFAWLNLIPSFGLTLIYINLHVFMGFLFPGLFCKLGEEWLPKAVAGASSDVKAVSKGAGLVETGLLIMLDFAAMLFLFFLLIIMLAIIDSVFGILGHIFDFFSTINETSKEILDSGVNTSIDLQL